MLFVKGDRRLEKLDGWHIHLRVAHHAVDKGADRIIWTLALWRGSAQPMLWKPKRKIDGHLIPHSSYLHIYGRSRRNRVAHSRPFWSDACRPHTLTFNVSGHFRATGDVL